MRPTDRCGTCGVPLGISRTMHWTDEGVIRQRRDPSHRMIFFESENLDRLWETLCSELGVTREHLWEIVIAAKSRATRAFLRRSLPWYLNVISRFVGYRALIRTIEWQGLVMGYGKITVGGQFPEWGMPRRITVYIEDPYSIPLFCGDFKGAAEVLEKRAAGITYQALDSRRHQVEVALGDEKLKEEEFRVDGEEEAQACGVAYRRCAECGVPLDLQDFEWDLDTGVIRERETGRRLAFFGTAGLKAVFGELVHELGDRVVDIIVDGERRNTLVSMNVEEAREGPELLRRKAALRGLGYLEEMGMEDGALHLRVCNPAVEPYLVGLALGIYELMTGDYGRASWSVEGNVLSIEIVGAG